MDFPVMDRNAVSQVWTVRLTIVLAAALATMSIGTHIPMPAGATQGVSDKLIHLLMFGTLGTIAGLRLWAASQWGGPGLVATWSAGVAYAIVDEVTQPLAGRYCEVADAVADGLGLVVGLLLASVIRRALMLAYPPLALAVRHSESDH